MIRHVVMWKIKPDLDKDQIFIEMERKLKNLLNHIPEIKHLEVGKDILATPSSFDVCLITSFDNIEDLRAYQEHPEHKKVVEYIKQVVEDRKVVDYTV